MPTTSEPAGALTAPPDVEIEFYWRPGCPFCMMLERSLDRAEIPLLKRNIWDDPEAAAYVRSVADGNETVPTVRIGSTALVNPSSREVATVLSETYPDSSTKVSSDGQSSTFGKLLQRLLGG